MRLRVELGLGVGALLAVQLLGSFAAIGLVARTTPVSEHILREEAALASVEEMLAVLASDGEPEAFDRALAQVRRTARDDREEDLVRRIELRERAALLGDPAARLDLVALARELSTLHRDQVTDLERQSRFLARAGAWASALLGGFGFLLSVVLFRRLGRRLEDPVSALDRMLQAVHRGDLRQRAPVRDAPEELRRIAEHLNLLVDRYEEASRQPIRAEERTDRALLVAVLDQLPEPVLVVDANGQQLASNAAALALLGDPSAPLREVAQAVRTHRAVPGWELVELPKASAFLCRRPIPAPAPEVPS